MIAMNRGDFDRLFDELTGARAAHSRTGRARASRDRSAAELRASYED